MWRAPASSPPPRHPYSPAGSRPAAGGQRQTPSEDGGRAPIRGRRTRCRLTGGQTHAAAVGRPPPLIPVQGKNGLATFRLKKKVLNSVVVDPVESDTFSLIQQKIKQQIY